MAFATLASQRIQAIQAILMDLHDPSGVYFHRAWSSCLAGLMAAVLLYLAPAMAQPLLVVAALIFMHTTSDHDRPRCPTTLLGSFMVVLLSSSLLVLTRFQPILQAVVLIGLGFLAQYLAQFGSAFTVGVFVWILSVAASAENPTVEQLPILWLNLALGFLIAYLCYFWIAPYQPHRVFLSIVNRNRLRLAARLHHAVDRLDPRLDGQYFSDRQWNTDLDRRIVSLMNTQDDLLEKGVQKKQPSSQELAHYHQQIAAQRELYEAILVLEQSLMILKATADVPLQLQIGLTQLSRQAAHLLLGQTAPPQAWGSGFQLDADFEHWLQAFVSDDPQGETGSHRAVALETQIQRQNTYQAMQTLVSKVNAVADLTLQPRRTAHER